MKYIKKKYNESLNIDTDDLVQDIRNILFEFSDDGINTDVVINNTKSSQILITIGGDDKRWRNGSIFQLDDDKRGALIRIIRLSESDWSYQAFYVGDILGTVGRNNEKSLYIYDDNRGVRSGGVKLTNELRIGNIQIFLNKKREN